MATVLEYIASGDLVLAQQALGQPTLEELHAAEGYTIPLIAHDYPARTAWLWNAMYQSVSASYVNAMVVANPARVVEILTVFRGDPKYRGGGCGVGFKDIVLSHLDAVDGTARAMGAVNIIARRDADDALVGSNTDGDGFVRGLLPLLQRRGIARYNDVPIVVLGAGGAGNAVACALALHGANVIIVNRTVAKAQRLAVAINTFLDTIADDPRTRSGSAVGVGVDAMPRILAHARVLVNTTDVGKGALAQYAPLAAATLPATDASVAENRGRSRVAIAALPSDAVVADIAAFTGPTPLLQYATENGLATQDAIPMVVEQAIDAFRIVHPGIADRAHIAQVMWASEGISVIGT